MKDTPESGEAVGAPAPVAAAPKPPAYERDADGKIVYQLKDPIQFGSEKITELRFKEVRAKYLRGMPLNNPTVGHALDVAALLSGQPAAVLDELSGEDLQEVSRIVGF